ncbi:MAG: bifunctional adenosylcobinamide kinase/adenosylcobinamide-phosphate guanylyltransferase [Actinomycetota bacterium]|nr:bifunctional adenosylcobinamide kinase/adenosylcobinamide-phosphate guanylyltransferase [Acidimicrobiia bacterium]MDQ3470298.1 bifunctional adenosylcobinamide kinase/adenosylcobinamide-phosphate guanylyltransferase [Actinomycetota bacterium]
MITLLLGGARSGKSALAGELGRRHDGPVTYLATCPPLDDELRERIARHRADRPGWPTIEEPFDLAGALATVDGTTFVIVDCLTLWVSNLLARGDDDASIHALATRTAALAAGRAGPTVVVSNEVGLGVHPSTELGRRYRDVLGDVNQAWVRVAGTTLLLVAGRAVRLDDPVALLA